MRPGDLTPAAGEPLVPGDAVGEILRLDAPLSFWGGVDSSTGRVVDVHHPQCGVCLAGRVVVLPAARGSSSSSSVLLECVRAGTAPAAILLGRPDPILAVGAVVAQELYDRGPAVLVADPAGLPPDGTRVAIDRAGAVTVA